MASDKPTLESGKLTLDIDPDDKLWYIGNVTQQLADSGTTAVSFTPLLEGLTLLESGTPQGDRGGLLPVKLQGIANANTEIKCTWRVVCANGEQFDRTLYFKKVSK